MSGTFALSTTAQPATTGRQVALDLETACPENANMLLAFADDGHRVLGRWVTIAGPTFGLQPSDPRPGLTAHAVDPLNPRRLLVSEGKTIQLSDDGGCTWNERHRASSSLDAAGATERIRQIEFAGREADRRAYALMSRPNDQAGAVRVLVSDNGGVGWEDRSVGLPPLHTRSDSLEDLVACPNLWCPTAVLAVAPSDPDVAYVAVADPAAPSLFRTGNAGRSWERLTSLSFLGMAVTEMSVAPDNADDVWGVFGGKLGRSRDGGRNWEWPSALDGVAGLHLSSDAPGAQVQVLRRTAAKAAAPFNRITRSVDDGITWQDIELTEPLGGVPAAAAGGGVNDLVVATESPAGVFKFDPATKSLVDIAAPDLDDVAGPRRDSTAEPAYWFRQYASLAAFVPGPAAEPGPAGKLPVPPVEPVHLGQDRVPGTLVPAKVELDLGTEGTRVVDYRLELPALPTPVDIWFLIDTSGSMSGAIEGVRDGFESIIEELSASGFDAWFGLATFPDRQGIYDRQADVAPPSEDLYAALDRLAADGGAPEIHPTALYQSATGAGQLDAGIPPGRGATFRPQALKIIVHATDEAYGTEGSGPTREEAAHALSARGIRHVGLDLAAGGYDTQVPPDEEGLKSTKRDHDFMARATRALAPAGGIDCNGDGTNELEEGDPITCPIARGRDRVAITPAIISAIRGVRDDTAVALTVVDSGGVNVEIGQPIRSPVNVKAPNSLPFAVRFTCPPEMTGKVGDVLLRATVRGVPSADGTARVGCGVVQTSAASTPRSRPPAAPLPVIVAPGQVVPTVEPPLSPLHQTSPAQVGQTNPQAGAAAEPGEVATAKQRAGRGGPQAGSPTALPEGDERNTAPAGTMVAGAALAVALGGWAVRRDRRQVATTQRSSR